MITDKQLLQITTLHFKCTDVFSDYYFYVENDLVCAKGDLETSNKQITEIPVPFGTIQGDISFADCNQLKNLNNFPKTVGNRINLSGCVSLVTLEGLQNVENFSNKNTLISIDLDNCLNLEDVSCLPNNTYVLKLNNCPKINLKTLSSKLDLFLIIDINFLDHQQLKDLIYVTVNQNISYSFSRNPNDYVSQEEQEAAFALNDFSKNKDLFQLKLKLDPLKGFNDLVDFEYTTPHNQSLNL